MIAELCMDLLLGNSVSVFNGTLSVCSVCIWSSFYYLPLALSNLSYADVPSITFNAM